MKRSKRKRISPVLMILGALIALAILSLVLWYASGRMLAAAQFITAHWFIAGLLLLLLAALAVWLILTRARRGWRDEALQHEAGKLPSPSQRRAKRAIAGITLSKVDQLSGEDFETFVAALFTALGYTNVRQTPLSGDYGIDVIAEGDSQRYGIQCKRYSGTVGHQAVQEVVSGLKHYGCTRGIVVTNSSFTANAKTLAEDNGVTLINRASLSYLMKRAASPLP